MAHQESEVTSAASQARQPLANQRAPNPLDTLQSMVNAILLEVGKALRSANKKGVKTIGYDNERLQAFVPSAVENFHLALDELESDIVRAKAVLARDLRELRVKKYRLENPNLWQDENHFTLAGENIQSNRSPMQTSESLKPDTSTALEDHGLSLNTSGDQSDNAMSLKKEDNPPSALSMEITDMPPDLTDAAVKVEEPRKLNKPQELKNDETAGEILPELPDKPGSIMEAQDSAPSALPEVPGTTEDQSMDFDSMFDDFDFTVGGATSQNNFGTPGGDLNLTNFDNQLISNDDGTNLAQVSQDGTATSNFGLLDVSMNSANNDIVTDGANVFGDDFGTGPPDNDMSTFDDILNGIGFVDTGDDGTGDDMMQHEFDDAFFGLDNTEES